ncbi:hypothetical protein LINGRAPRIM_LOCUS1093 [Linum grandiflorum]
MPWEGDLYLNTLLFAEYGNHGAGAGTDERVDGRDRREGGLVSDIGEEIRRGYEGIRLRYFWFLINSFFL